MRVALGYALVYALLAGSVLAAFYWAASRYIDAQLDAGLREDFQYSLEPTRHHPT